MSKPHRLSEPNIKADLSAPFGQQRLKLDILFGKPHGQASPQETEPFWHQYPEPSAPPVYYYPACNLYSANPLYLQYLPEMDTAPIIIGYKSRYNASNEKREVRDGRPRIPREIVQVYAGDEEVGTISLGVLTRFSRYARDVFPKPPTVLSGEPVEGASAATSSAQSAKQPTTPKKWSDSDDEAVELKFDTPGPTPRKQEHSTSEPSKQRLFSVYNNDVSTQPGSGSVKYLLNWMENNKSTRNTDPLLAITPSPLHTIKLNVLVNIYAAALGFNLTPFPHDLRHEILTRLTAIPVDRQGFEYIAVRLPLSDPIITRLLTSHFEHIDAQAYAEGVADDIFSFVTQYDGDNPDEPFFKRYNKISRSREFKQRQAKRDQRKEDRFDSLRGDFENFAGTDALLPAEAVKTPADKAFKKSTKQPTLDTSGESTPSSAEQTPAEIEDEIVPKKTQGRHRNRREQQKKGKGKTAAK